ncbi:uncharacterized protein LOC115446948 isoform X2 [Manduca sexta]|uniref:Uncharacterized protein n=1 Tax=Manduca sexta TaxID=7130 RepID=A0A922CQB2_MANSE|nr:uncharacterized protein LOC115446948 isoform X2 [Manduca sexta]KAG6455465.1 hypothetical protein O3G_MSEX009209 [Manduca sexta]
MDRIPLVEEYRLIERCEAEVNGAWKDLPVDFLSTQWVDQSACYLPTYVPLVSGIFGLVWTTMFLMCSSSSRTHTGLQRPWRVLPPVFIFSLAMTGLCVYTSVITHSGLQELCAKLGEITGSVSCTYTINVATLAYERRIRGVYQATQLTIVSAWLHTACWLMSALLTLARVLMAVDFQLIRVRVELRCNIDKMLEQNEQHLHTVSPDVWVNDENEYDVPTSHLSKETTSVYYKNKTFDTETDANEMSEIPKSESDILYFAQQPEGVSELSLVPAERCKLARLMAYQSVPKDKRFIVKLVYDLVDTIDLPELLSKDSDSPTNVSSTGTGTMDSDRLDIARQYGQEQICSRTPDQPTSDMPGKYISVSKYEAEVTAKEIRRTLQEKVNKQIIELSIERPSLTDKPDISFESSLNITPDMKKTLELKGKIPEKADETLQPTTTKKSNLKNMGVQTDQNTKKKDGTQKVQISESKTSHFVMSDTTLSDESVQDQETQTKHKEKQD